MALRMLREGNSAGEAPQEKFRRGSSAGEAPQGEPGRGNSAGEAPQGMLRKGSSTGETPKGKFRRGSSAGEAPQEKLRRRSSAGDAPQGKLRRGSSAGKDVQGPPSLGGVRFVAAAENESLIQIGLGFQVADVKKPLLSVDRIGQKGNVVQFGPEEQDNFVKNKDTGETIMLRKKGKSFVMDVQLKDGS